MTTQPKPVQIRKAPVFTKYVVVWSMLGTLSFGLLMVIGLAPEWLDDLRPASLGADPQSNQGQRAAARLAADFNALKDSVAQIQLDLSKVKTDVASQSEQQKAVSAQVTSIEMRMATPQDAAKIEVAVPPPLLSAETAAPAQAIDPAATTAAKPAAPLPARTPKVINADATASASLETGSVSAPAKIAAATEAISFGPAIVKAAPKPLGVKISSGASTDSLRLSWSLLAEKHGDALKGLEARYTSAGDDVNPSFDLFAGPIKSRAEAAKVCKNLTAKGVPCTVGAFAGEAL